MSAEQSRLRSAIQRIAKEDPELRGAIDAAKSRGDQPGGTGVGESDGERDRICCDGSTSDSANPGTSERDTADGGQDGLDPNDPANLESGPGELTGVVDCATGQPVCLDGDGFIPPEGWDDPQSPPINADYQEGFYWGVLDSERTNSSTPDEAASKHLEGSSFRPGRREESTTDSDGNVSGYTYWLEAISTGEETGGFFFVTRQGCSDSIESYCTEIPFEDWPSDGCVNLAIVGGKIVGSKYDPENDGSYSAPRDEIELCDEDGHSILIRPSADGGWKSIESLDGDIDPETQKGYLYAPDGKRIRQISPSEFRDDMV